MELFEAMRTTFSAREYTSDPLPDDVLFEILDNARFAPSGGNRQGVHITIVRNQTTKKTLSDLAIPAAKRYIAQINLGENPWNSASPTAADEATIEATTPAPMLTETFINADVVLVFSVDLKVVASMDQYLDRVGVVSGGSVYPMVWNTLLAARQAGFGGTMTTLAISQEDKIQTLLGIPKDHAVCAIMPLGKPVKQLTKLRRNPVEFFVTQERFDGAPFTKP
ncbi:MAG: nitroreductase family protein [Rhodospirillaceae bacterium]|jgi:nitroreductase|nr:nitroreductase family protein [Rhodospirillaceae bacterium]MBT5664184.1 nitroreductase family protein [Rhodospirillaceae bacterium]